MSEELRTPEEWMEITGITVFDPDGWDRTAFEGPGSWYFPITEKEFLERVHYSTIDIQSWVKYVDRFKGDVA